MTRHLLSLALALGFLGDGLEADAFLALAAIVASEMYGHAPPIVVVTATDYAKLKTGDHAKIFGNRLTIGPSKRA